MHSFSCTSDADCSGDNTCNAGSCIYTGGCECHQECQDDYYGKILVGSIIATVICIIFIIVPSAPVCCGYDMKKDACPKIAGGLAIAIGIFMIFVPFIASISAADGATDDVCNACHDGCTDEQRKAIKDILSALGVLVAYTAGMGFLPVIFGIVAAAMGCCACCPCCGPLKRKLDENGKTPAPATVVGTPA